MTFNRLRKITIERAKKKKRIKEEFVDSGQYENMKKMIRKKREPSVRVEDLPF